MTRGILVRLVKLYQQLISPLLGPRCRYYPSCSAYAIAALHSHGALRGVGLATWRLLRCNPWSDGGVDFPPPARSNRPTRRQFWSLNRG